MDIRNVEDEGPWHGTGEVVVANINDFCAVVEKVSRPYADHVPWKFIWRGLERQEYALYSKMYRELKQDIEGHVSEEVMLRREQELLTTARREWHIGQTSRGRLSDLDVLALIQHHEGATRLIDFSHNALVGLWFAVRDEDLDDDTDGRVIAVDTSNTRKKRQRCSRDIPDEWHYAAKLPWATEWTRCEEALFWSASPIDPRMASQHGCFLLGRVPDENQQYTSVPISAISAEQLDRICRDAPGSGKHPGDVMFTIRIAKTARRMIRQTLERSYGLSHARLFPDPHGMVKYGP